MTTANENMCTETYDPITEEDLEDPTGGEETPEELVDPEEAQSALAALKPTLLAMPSSEVRRFRVGTTTAVGIGLAYATAFSEDRLMLAEAFRDAGFDVAAHDDIGIRAKAFWQADIQMRQELGSEGSLRSLLAEAKPLRAKMARGATYLWGEDEDLGEVVAEIRSGHSHADRADDLGALAELFTEHWDQAEGRCDVTQDDIARAAVLGAEILELLSPAKSKEIDEARDLRNRAAEYLRQGIDNVRDAAAYVFRHAPAVMERYPSLYVYHGRKRSNGKSQSEASAEPDAAAAAAGPESSEPSPQPDDQAEEITETYIPSL